jgi:hypothetical protein
LILIGALVGFASQAAVIYKWTDADGVVHYSDQAVPGAEKIVTAGTSTYSGTDSVRGLSSNNTAVKKPSAPAGFQQLNIGSPRSEQTFFGDEPVPVSLIAVPSLHEGQSVSWTLNGAALEQSPTATSFALQSLARGTYSIGATVTDAGGETYSVAAVTFYVRQPSELSPQHRR